MYFVLTYLTLLLFFSSSLKLLDKEKKYQICLGKVFDKYIRQKYFFKIFIDLQKTLVATENYYIWIYYFLIL